MKNLAVIARSIIKKNIYLTLATSAKGKPWAAPLFYAYDKNYNFYFVSEKTSQHARDLLLNPHVAVTIFNSKEVPERVNGLQIKARGKVLGLRDLPKALFIYLKRPETKLMAERFKNYRNPLEYIGRFPFRIYKIIPERFYILDPKIIKRDRRVEVKLN